MVFIVSDQRIATENFEKGKIYKVVFLDESIFYGVCIGIGSNFVMLSGNISGYLFPLTMETASQVESIDLFDPTPPEPPVPWTNLLQYQTGEPPFTFNTTDDQLFSWYITGAGVGDKTANLFDSSSIALVPVSTSITRSGTNLGILPQGDYVLSATAIAGATQLYRTIKDGDNYNFETIGELPYTFTADGTSEQIIRTSGSNFTSWDSTGYNDIMLNTGSTALPYEPYGYKIPILCNEHLTNIYLDAPLKEDEILYNTDVDTVIITDIGDNALSVLTESQPSEMQIVYKIADR